MSSYIDDYTKILDVQENEYGNYVLRVAMTEELKQIFEDNHYGSVHMDGQHIKILEHNMRKQFFIIVLEEYISPYTRGWFKGTEVYISCEPAELDFS